MSFPTPPKAGLKLSTRGATVKLPELEVVPTFSVTLIDPLNASAGTTAVSCVLEIFWNEAAVGELPNLTCEAVLRPVPLIVTVMPGPPLVGEKLVTLCAHATLAANSAHKPPSS